MSTAKAQDVSAALYEQEQIAALEAQTEVQAEVLTLGDLRKPIDQVGRLESGFRNAWQRAAQRAWSQTGGVLP